MFSLKDIKIYGRDRFLMNALKLLIAEIDSNSFIGPINSPLPEICIFTGYETFDFLLFSRRVSDDANYIVIGPPHYRCIFSDNLMLKNFYFIDIGLPVDSIADEIISWFQRSRLAKLTQRNSYQPSHLKVAQKRVVGLLLSGYSLVQVSRICNINYRTVSRYKRTAMTTMGVQSFQQLQIKFWLCGISSSPMKK